MKFSQTHEWVNLEKDSATVGISDYAQKELGSIVYVELPKVGAVVDVGDEIVVLESTKAAVDIYAPLSGEIIAVNENLRSSPETINASAQSKGWLFKLRIHNPAEMDFLMDEPEYKTFIASS